ncbi:odorant receptor 63a-like isoform X3 [Odontomachus brunneus]|uniref:odorant receptor 63a-like isoform X3 n=1 Tax=Odontomachus brunneus TaxID=486640 RepID=UPI0013F1DCFC|nr:odorant receptor 63a-like isoform X3 [Odontomachus brunneus]
MIITLYRSAIPCTLTADIYVVQAQKQRTDDLRVLLSDDHNFRFSRQVTESALEPRQVLIYSMTAMFVTIPVLMPTLLDILLPLNESRSRQIAVFAEFGVDKDKYFFPIFFYTTVMIINGISIMVAADTMHVACTAHACSLFQLIGHQIENITSRVKAIDEVDVSSSYDAVVKFESFQEELIYQEYIVCLKKHQLAVEFVNILNDTHRIVAFSFSLLIGAAFSLVGIRTTQMYSTYNVLQIVYVLDQLEEIIRYLFIIMGAILQLMIVCYSGQKLMDESENIFYRAYAAEWYRFSLRLKSLLIITLYRSIVPCKLTAGNLYPLSMTIAAAVIRTGMSYFTAFLSLKE